MIRPVSNAGTPTDSAAFKAMVEIEMIAKQAIRLFERQLPDGLTHAQFGVLNRLARLQAKETITEIAKAFEVSQPTMSSTVGRLLEKGYVETQSDARDARRKIVMLTETGAKKREAIIATLQPLFGRKGQITDEPELSVDWEVLLDQLAALRAQIEAL